MKLHSMVPALAVGAVCLVAVGSSLADGAARRSAEEVIRELNDGYVNAFVTGDMAWYREYLSDDFQCTLQNGMNIDKTEFVNPKGPSNVKSYKLEEVHIRVFNDDAALVNAISEFTLNDGTVRRSRYTDTYMKINGTWKAVAAHMTRIQ